MNFFDSTQTVLSWWMYTMFAFECSEPKFLPLGRMLGICTSSWCLPPPFSHRQES